MEQEIPKNISKKIRMPLQTAKDLIEQYQNNPSRLKNKKYLKDAATYTLEDIVQTMKSSPLKPASRTLLAFLKTLTSSSVWLSRSSLKYLSSLVDFTNIKVMKQTLLEEEILHHVVNKKTISTDVATHADIFKVIYDEVERIHFTPKYESSLTTPKVGITIVLVSGIFNEIFSTPAFERAAKYLERTTGLKYFSPEISGTKSSKHNIDLLEDQLQKYIKENPDEKLWLLGFSKGGVDCLHYLKAHKNFANRYIKGFSTIATPILGSSHADHPVFQIFDKLENTTQEHIPSLFSKKFALLSNDFRKTLSNQHQNEWFKENYKKLPENLVYTSLALESKWYESHLWMVLTKGLFRSDVTNDGVVDIDKAHFPEFFNSLNLGVLQGHHLIGARSSFYNQEALLEAHLILIDYYQSL